VRRWFLKYGTVAVVSLPWIAVPYGSIGKIEAWPIEGNEAYSIVALHLGAGGTSKYWLYFFPSQYVSGLKIRILGVESLL
jgi:hypothetical protein